MSSSLEWWANVAQIVSLPVSVVGLIVTIIMWRYPRPTRTSVPESACSFPLRLCGNVVLLAGGKGFRDFQPILSRADLAPEDRFRLSGFPHQPWLDNGGEWGR